MNGRPSWKLAGGLVAVVLAAGGAWGAKVCTTEEAFYPNVDADGNLGGGATVGEAKVCINAAKGTFKIKGSATVDNLSGETQKYDDTDFPPPMGVTFKRLKYRVKADGAAKFTASGTGNPLDT